MNSHFDPYARHYHSLSVKDLLEARDAFHVHLVRNENVFATAIGLYRIRENDPDATDGTKTREAAKQRGSYGARLLQKTVVKPWSWPCVLVFVKHWYKPEELNAHRDELVPPFIFMPDGRVVPVCVVQAPLYEGSDPGMAPRGFTSQVVAGGYPLQTIVQGREHIGSIGCIVTDGDKYYAITNQHVCGEKGREVSAVINGEPQRIGVSAGQSFRSVPFRDAYPTMPVQHSESHLDIGLIEMDDLAMWSSQIFGLGELGEIVDFHDHTAALDWIGCPVVAHGGASGRLEGEIQALFYRYRTVAGVDYVSDFLIGGRGNKALRTRRGDSGTVWCIDPSTDKHAKKGTRKRFRPFGVQWGGQKLNSDGGTKFTQFALASSLGVACRKLDVDVVQDWNTGRPEYWGAVGHYKIAQKATELVKNKALKQFLAENLEAISYDSENITADEISHDPNKFVPLADVPDITWKTNVNRGGEAARAQENWNHYADMDLPGEDGRTLDALCGTPPTLDIAKWKAFYKTAPAPENAKSQRVNQGSLPFRVWQIFDAMLQFRADGDAKRFLCAAGILAHYVGDACQPLHASMHSDGLNGASTGVHTTYEDRMVDLHASQIRGMLDKKFDSNVQALPLVSNGHDAGAAVVELMRRAHKTLAPETICEKYDEIGGKKNNSVANGLWGEFGKETVDCLADGIQTLAMLWESAYEQDQGAKDFKKGEIKTSELRPIYEDHDFLPSLHLANLNEADYPVGGAPLGRRSASGEHAKRTAPSHVAGRTRHGARG